MIRLRDYQREAIDAVHAAFDRGVRAPAVGLPTGTGKTIVFAQLAEERMQHGRALILAHRDELLRQAADKYREINPAADIGFVQAGINDLDHDVVIASVQTLSREKRLDQFPWEEFGTCVIDEAHHAVAPTYGRIIERLTPRTLLLGVSATLERGDKVGLGTVWKEVVYLKTLEEMIKAGYLVDIRAKRVKLNYNLGLLRSSHGDFVASQVGEMLDETGAYSVAANAYLEHASGRPAIVFTPTIASAHRAAATFLAAGVPAAAVDGEMPIEERRGILADLADGRTRVVANAMVLTEGFDEPSIGCIIVMRPTKSRPLYVQMVGRGTRLYPGKKDLLVLDLVGNDERVDLQSLPRMFGLSWKAMDGDAGAVEYLGRPAVQIAGLYDRGAGFAAEEVDLFERKDVNWSKLEDGRWLLGLGEDGDVFLVPSRGRWDVARSWYDRDAKRRLNSMLGADLDIGYAMGVAEEFMRKLGGGAAALTDKQAPWRAHKPSEKQLATLESLGVPVEPGLTKGEASDMIGAAFARKRGPKAA